jgi:nucleoid DNA-binding protein
MIYKADLDREVAFELGVPQNTVKKITGVFLDQLIHALVTHEAVSLNKFATLRVYTIRAPSKYATASDGKITKIFLHAYKKPYLKELLKKHFAQEETMEKYGVDESLNTPEPAEKKAGSTSKCPRCGETLERHGWYVVKCPNCGTEPFEEEKE